MEELKLSQFTSQGFQCCGADRSAARFRRRLLLFCGLVLCSADAGRGQDAASVTADDFKAAVRTTEPQTPHEQLSSFQVPDGFQVSLFASEPQLQKPLNMAFDADGRLWVSGSNEYPYPASTGEGHDSIRILEDTNGDGSADKVTVFADDLNIPMGVYPFRDGVIAFSIPNILFLRDTDGDNKADTREVLYGPFDTTRDTHGLNNAFRRGFDGWLYCCHGFNNHSQVAGSDGHSVTMNSGSTYRIRTDGSRIEHFTHGQVNPFGMTIDANGDLFNSDCHTKPVSLLLRGGYYESFGKPHDGIGYVPAVMDHLHGSTAIDALCQYQDIAFPQEFRDDIFVGNVMTSRVHRNSIVRRGSSIRMQEEPDFLTSNDPWFRPVDIQIGHDGAMYIADFYNRIIGHYEVPLDHPGRDRSRGRIWRVAYVGENSSPPAPHSTIALTQLPLPELLTQLKDARKFIRQHAADQIVDRLGSNAAPAVAVALGSSLQTDEQVDSPQLLWVLHRLNSLTTRQIEDAFTRGAPRTRIHVMRVCSELSARDQPEVLDASVRLLRGGLRDSDPMVRRAAADAAAQTPSIDVAKEVINAAVVSSSGDIHLQHALKIALKHQLQDSETAEWFASSIPPAVACDVLSIVMPATEGSAVGEISLKLLQSGHLKSENLDAIVRHAAHNMTSDSSAELLDLAMQLPQDSVRLKTGIWLAMSETLRTRKMQPPPSFQKWSGELALRQLTDTDISRLSWGSYSLDGRPAVQWGTELRSVPRNPQKLSFLSSLAGGESGVGLIRSRAFVLPFKMEVQICGHLGPPAEAPSPGNRVVLREYETGEVIESALAPRSDLAAVHKWSSGKFAGRRGYLEVVDGLSLKSYAWIGIGRPVPMVVKDNLLTSQQKKRLRAAVRILKDQVISGGVLSSIQQQQLEKITKAIQVDGSIRTLAAETLLRHRNKTELAGLADLLQTGSTPRLVDAAIVRFCCQAPNAVAASGKSEPKGDSDLVFVKNVFSVLDATLRKRLTQQLSSSGKGAALLLGAMEAGVPSADALRDGRLVGQLSGYGADFKKRVNLLVASLPDVETDTTELSVRIVNKIKLGEGSAENGLLVFEKNCQNCHRRSGTGGVAGPQLDGASTRGTARLLEDILHPNRNVDVAFRTSTLQLKSGKVVTGIVRPGNSSHLLTIVNTEGKVTEVDRLQVEERTDSKLSLMPGNVTSVLTEKQILNLVAFLLQ